LIVLLVGVDIVVVLLEVADWIYCVQIEHDSVVMVLGIDDFDYHEVLGDCVELYQHVMSNEI